jgi:hypothetical protein
MGPGNTKTRRFLMSMLIKAGVDISRLKPPIRKKLSKVHALYEALGEHMIITCAYDGNHLAGSFHYAHLAIDLAYPLKMSNSFRDDLKAVFGPDYDIVFEQNHIHIEYDPKS